MHTPPDAPAIACVLINWNNWQDTANCLDALRLQDFPALSVLVVDNGSTNDSLAQLRALHPWATYLASPQNLGFPRACNLGARHPVAATAPYLWLLNNDTLAPPDTASQLVRKAESEPRAAVVGSVLRDWHTPGRVQAWGGGTISRWTAFNRHFTSPSPLGRDAYLTFASVLIRREAFEQLGGLYEGAFMYFEDADFCLRAHDAGWLLAVAGETAVLHKEGGSDTGILPSPAKDRTTTLAGLLFVTRHAPVPLLARVLFLASRLAKRLLQRRFDACRAVLAGAADFRHHPEARPS